MNLKQGTILQGGKYRIERELGHGGFGVTYLATQVGLNRKVAIKEFFMRDLNGREKTSVTCSNQRGLYSHYREKFSREAENLSKLHHPHIVKVLESFECNNTCYYSMEYIQGVSMDNLIDVRGRLTEEESLHYFYQLSGALQFMHSHKMLHLDMKPF